MKQMKYRRISTVRFLFGLLLAAIGLAISFFHILGGVIVILIAGSFLFAVITKTLADEIAQALFASAKSQPNDQPQAVLPARSIGLKQRNPSEDRRNAKGI